MTEVVASRSHSQLSDWLRCSWAYRLKRQVHAPQAPSVWQAGGKAFHTATEVFDKHVGNSDAGQLQDPEPWMNLFVDEFRAECDHLSLVEPDASKWRTAGRRTKEKPLGENAFWWEKAGQAMVATYIKWRAASAEFLQLAYLDGEPAVEVEVTLPVGDVPVRGYVDRLFVDPRTGLYLVVDLKTGSRTPESALQLALYALELQPRVDQPIQFGAYYMARDGDLTYPKDLADFTPDRLGLIYKRLDRAIREGIFIPNIDSHCKTCDVRSSCIFQGGEEPK